MVRLQALAEIVVRVPDDTPAALAYSCAHVVYHCMASASVRRRTPLSLLELHDVTVKYGPLVALRDVRLSVDEGEIVTLLGANGAGKTTCLEATLGLIPKAGGSIVFDGADITKRAPEAIVKGA